MVKVSVLMPVYKTKEEYLREAILSILNQIFTDFEFLILDDCPADDREKIVKSYQDKRIKYFKNEKNLGISASRNKLIDLAQGKFLAVFDHDDVALPNRLEVQVNFLEENPQIGICGSAYEWMHKCKSRYNPQFSKQIEKALMAGCAVHHPSAMIRKSVLDENNVRYEPEYSPAEDYALWCRLIGKTQFYNMPEILVFYRKHSSQTSQTQKEKMKKSTKLIHKFVRDTHPNLWHEVCFNSPSIVRVRLFGLLPIAKFKYHGLTYNGFLKYVPFLSIKTKLVAVK